MAHYSCRHGRKTRRNSTFELFFSERLRIFQNEMTLFKDLRSRKVLLFVPLFFAGVVVQGLKSMLAKLCICSLSNPVFLRKFQSCREFPLLTEHSTTPSWPQRGHSVVCILQPSPVSRAGSSMLTCTSFNEWNTDTWVPSCCLPAVRAPQSSAGGEAPIVCRKRSCKSSSIKSMVQPDMHQCQSRSWRREVDMETLLWVQMHMMRKDGRSNPTHEHEQ